MINILEEIEKVKSEGNNEANAEARICQDIILCGIANSSLKSVWNFLIYWQDKI